MLISMNWISDFVDLTGLDKMALIRQFSLSTAEVENEIFHKGADLSGVVAAQIVSVENHPESHKLHLLKVDAGDGQLMDFVAMGLGGHAAEQLYLGEFTTGATSDLKKATEVCRRMVTQFGMSEKLGPVYLDGDQEVFVGMEFGQSRGYSEEMAARIDAEVKRLLEECYQKAVDALSANRDRMEKLVDALLKYDTISRREFVTLMETGALPDIQDADTRTTGDVMMQDMADEKKEESSEKSAETPEKSAETPDKTADAPENHPDTPHEA